MNTNLTEANAEWLASGCVECAKKYIDPGLVAAIRKEALLEAAEMFEVIGYSKFRTPAEELRRMAEGEK